MLVWIGYETNYLYDGQMPVCEQEFEDGVLKQTRIHLLGARGIEGIITVPATGAASLNWLFYDGHGNMVRTMNTSFALSAFQWRGVWGERTNSTPGRGYCANLGHPEDETGLVYMRARYYEPTTGRFVSEDPARDGVNWYLYADGDPVNRVDPYGWFVIELPNGFWIRFDSAYSQEGTGNLIRDLTWGTTKGGQRQTMGSIRPDGSVKHGAEMPEKLKDLIRGNSNAFKKAMKQGGYGLGAYVLLCSLDSAFLSDPLAFGEIVDILGGEWELFGGGIRVGAS